MPAPLDRALLRLWLRLPPWRTQALAVYMLALGCSKPPAPPQCYPEANYPNYTNYGPGTMLSTEDRATLDRVAACLAPLKTTPLTSDELWEAQCYGSAALEVRDCVKVATAPDWYVSKCTGEQFFPCGVPLESCQVKGLVPTAECPCACRAMIENNTTIWATPNRRLLPGYAVTLMTGCNYPWVGRLAACSSPNLVTP